MFIVESYAVAIIMCFITMICWGSWANTTKLVSNKKWEFPLFYWDYSIGLLLCSLLFAFTLVLWAKPVAVLYLIFSRRAAVV